MSSHFTEEKYQATLDYMFNSLPMYQRIGSAAYKANLDNTIELLNVLGNPYQQFKSIHIAGTNGKGSTSNTLASILQTCGLKVGLYTSPHLKDFRERIRINGEMISKEYIVDFIENNRPHFERIEPSFFEMSVELAFQYFAEQKVDIAVIEVGLGGRLDSTNVITPELSIITNIGFDHVQFLGNDLPSIAAEKAGIIKPKTPVVIGETQAETEAVFIKKARLESAPIIFADKHYSLQNYHIENGWLCADVFRNNELFIQGLRSPLAGLYQLKNLATALQSLEILNEKGYHISKEQITQGIENIISNTGFAGRWQILSQNPLTICDTGHNEDGIKYVLQQISQTPHKQLHFVLGMVNDKDIEKVLSMLPKNALYYFCKPDIPRGLDAHILQTKAIEQGFKGNVYTTVKEALQTAQKAALENDLVFVGGSTFVVGEAI